MEIKCTKLRGSYQVRRERNKPYNNNLIAEFKDIFFPQSIMNDPALPPKTQRTHYAPIRFGEIFSTQ